MRPVIARIYAQGGWSHDLLSHLIQVEVDDAELTMDDIRMLVTALVTGAEAPKSLG